MGSSAGWRAALLLLFLCAPSLAEGSIARRHKRSIGQFGDMIRRVTRREALLFNNYGNHCGFRGGDLPVVDEVDRCCRSHDRCYDAASEGPCAWAWLGPTLLRYSWSWNGTHLHCGGENDACEMAACQCDVTAATCFSRHPWNPEHKHASIWDLLA